MRFPITDEMHRLMEIFEPYMDDDCQLKESAPQAAVEAREEFHKLYKVEKDKHSPLNFM